MKDHTPHMTDQEYRNQEILSNPEDFRSLYMELPTEDIARMLARRALVGDSPAEARDYAEKIVYPVTKSPAPMIEGESQG